MHPAYLVQVLRHMRLDPHIGELLRQFARAMQLRRGTGGRKTWRDGVAQAVYPVPTADQRFGLAQAELRVGVAQPVGAVAVLQHFARDHAQAALLRFLHEHIDRRRVRGGKAQCGGHAVAHEFVQKEAGDLVRVSGVVKLLFMRKGVVLQPGQQAVGGRADHIGLRVMDVQIDKAGGDAQAGPMGHGQVGVVRRQLAVGADSMDAHDAVGFASSHQQTIGFVPNLGAVWVRKPQQTRAPAGQFSAWGIQVVCVHRLVQRNVRGSRSAR